MLVPSGVRDEVHQKRITAVCHLAWSLVPLVVAPHSDNRKLGQDDTPLGIGHILGPLNAKSKITIEGSNSNQSLGPGPHSSFYAGMISRTSSFRGARRKKLTD